MAPDCSAPCTAPEAPPSDCSSSTSGIVPQMFFSPEALLASDISPMTDDGVIGYMAMTSLVAWATCAAAVLPSMVTIFLLMYCLLFFGLCQPIFCVRHDSVRFEMITRRQGRRPRPSPGLWPPSPGGRGKTV